jgi:The GLUG motif./M26 IgA1-specific Metallo-endopeptidase N-terminal region.
MSLSQEFSQSAFGLDESLISTVSTYTELYEAVKTNPSAIINVSKDIKVEGTYALQEIPEFRGTLNGQGHTISGAQHALFDNLDDATVKNLVISETKIENEEKDKAGGISNSATNSTLRNVHLINSTLNLKGEGDVKPFVGGLIGEGISTQILDSSVQGTVLSGAYVGGLVGRADGARIYNSYTTGEISNSHTGGDIRIGGIVGNGFNKTSITNTYTTMTIQGGNGILGSDYNGANKDIVISNSLSLAKVLTPDNYKVYGTEPIKEWKNNYEVEENEGKTSVEIGNLDVKKISVDKINTDFFKNTLNFGSEAIWHTSQTDSINNLPTLKNDDPSYIPDAIQGGDVTVHYQNESGKKIADDIVLKGEVGTSYTSTKKTIKGYVFKEIKGKASGEFTEKAQTVTYVYQVEKTTPVPNKQQAVSVYRLYNKKSKEHLYTADSYEYKHLPELSRDWVREGVNFKAYKKSDSTTKPVYRVYNPKSGEHLNTTDSNEVKVLKSKGWKGEGVAFYTPKTGGKPVYRLFNPKAGLGAHFMTADSYEKSILTKAPKEWKYEGVAWNSVK